MASMDKLYPTSQAMEVFTKQEEGEHWLSYSWKICRKGFVSGRGLGGHMRVHGPASMDRDNVTDTRFTKRKKPRASNDKSMKDKDDEQGLDGNGRNLMSALQRNPEGSWRFADQNDSILLDHEFDSKPIDFSLISNQCGKDLSSWKGLFDHMKCHPETHEDSGDAQLQESRKHETQDNLENDRSESDAEIDIDHPSGNSSRFDKWMKGKRFKRSRYAPQLKYLLEQFGSSINSEGDAEIVIYHSSGGIQTSFISGRRERNSRDLCMHPNLIPLNDLVRQQIMKKKILQCAL